MNSIPPSASTAHPASWWPTSSTLLHAGEPSHHRQYGSGEQRAGSSAAVTYDFSFFNSHPMARRTARRARTPPRGPHSIQHCGPRIRHHSGGGAPLGLFQRTLDGGVHSELCALRGRRKLLCRRSSLPCPGSWPATGLHRLFHDHLQGNSVSTEAPPRLLNAPALAYVQH